MNIRYQSVKAMKQIVRDQEGFKEMLNNGEFDNAKFTVRDSHYLLDNIRDSIKSKYAQLENSLEQENIKDVNYEKIIKVGDDRFYVYGDMHLEGSGISYIRFNDIVSTDEVVKICNSIKDYENCFRGEDIATTFDKVDLVLDGDLGLMNGNYKAAAEVIRNSDFDESLLKINSTGKNEVDKYFEYMKNFDSNGETYGFNYFIDRNTYENKTFNTVGNENYVSDYKDFVMALDEKGYRPSNNFDLIDTAAKDKLLTYGFKDTINYLNSEGKTLLDVAYENKDILLANDLMQNGAKFSEDIKENERKFIFERYGQENQLYQGLDKLQDKISVIYGEEVKCESEFWKTINKEGHFEKLVQDGEFFKNDHHYIRSDHLLQLNERCFDQEGKIYEAIKEAINDGRDAEVLGCRLRMTQNNDNNFDVYARIDRTGMFNNVEVNIENVSVNEVKNMIELNTHELYGSSLKFDTDNAKILEEQKEHENVQNKIKEDRGIDLAD